MCRHIHIILAAFALVACGGVQHARPTGGGEVAGRTQNKNEFQIRDSNTAGDAHGVKESRIKPTKTETAIKFFVVDKDKGPIEGVVISLTAPDGKKYYTEETDAVGYAEVLVPAGQKYDLVYLSLGRRDITASVPVSDIPNQTLKLTLRYKRYVPPGRSRDTSGVSAQHQLADTSGASQRQQPADTSGASQRQQPEALRFVLKGIYFDTGKSTIQAKSYPRLDSIVEYMTHKRSSRIEISGHTDNVGNPTANKKLSLDRADACRDYFISKGIDGSRIQSIGYGEERPISSNDTPEGRQKNRRIEAIEL